MPTAPETELSAAVAGQAQELGPALKAQARHGAALMATEGVVGHGAGLTEDGEPAVVVYLLKRGVAGVPKQLDGVPVVRTVTGLFMARSDETSRARPAPIGFSVGHPDITAGTLGARVKDGSNVYILSNNHVLANSNDANLGDSSLQPGSYDGGSDPADQIGTLHDYEPIKFDGSNNTMDAAIAVVNPDSVSGSTPADEGYGAPGTSPADAFVDQGVQKYGRTTGHTTGVVEEVNVTVTVCYDGFAIFCTKSATFVDQISISDGTFSDGGDSGSLIVATADNAPVGLLFAGSSSRTIANPIQAVLDRFGVTVDPTVPDGGGSGGSTNTAPTADFTYSCTDLTCDFTDQSTDDSGISSWSWDFGDEATSTSQNPSHTYASEGTYSVTLSVTDDDGVTDDTVQSVSVSSSDGGGSSAGGIHTGDIDASSTSQGSEWTATVTFTVHDTDHTAEGDSEVSFDYSSRDVSGTASCTTGSAGTCTHAVSNIPKRSGDMTFTVTGIVDSDGSYSSTDNHDPDGDSDGTTITVAKP